MALVDEVWLQVISAQRRLGFTLPPDPIALPGGATAGALQAELAMLIARIKREGG